jgi:hypothetical protein
MMIFQTPDVVTAHWHPEVNAIRMEWITMLDSAALRAALDRGLRQADHQGITGWIVDTGGGSMPMAEHDEYWLARDWTPRAARSCLRAIATVLPRSEVASLDGDPWRVDEADGLLQARTASLQAALAWLATDPAPARADLTVREKARSSRG